MGTEVLFTAKIPKDWYCWRLDSKWQNGWFSVPQTGWPLWSTNPKPDPESDKASGNGNSQGWELFQCHHACWYIWHEIVLADNRKLVCRDARDDETGGKAKWYARAVQSDVTNLFPGVFKAAKYEEAVQSDIGRDFSRPLFWRSFLLWADLPSPPNYCCFLLRKRLYLPRYYPPRYKPWYEPQFFEHHRKGLRENHFQK